MKWMPMVPLKRVSACLSGNPSYTESFLITPIINSSETNSSLLKIGWETTFFLGPSLFSGLYVSFREGILPPILTFISACALAQLPGLAMSRARAWWWVTSSDMFCEKTRRPGRGGTWTHSKSSLPGRPLERLLWNGQPADPRKIWKLVPKKSRWPWGSS